MSVTNDIRVKMMIQAVSDSAATRATAANNLSSQIPMVELSVTDLPDRIRLVMPGVVDESDSGGGTVPRLETSIVGAEGENPTLKGVGLRVEDAMVMMRLVFALEAGVYQMQSFYQAVGAIAQRYPVGVLGPTSRPLLSAKVNLTIMGAVQIKEPVREASLIYFPIIVPYRASWDDSIAGALGANSPPS